MMYPNYNNYYCGSPLGASPTGLKGRPVSSLEEARVANVDFDGSLFIFPDVANRKIYTKQINLDGTASLKVYTQVVDTSPAPAYITREELDAAIEGLRNSFSNGKENKNDDKSNTKTSSNSTALNF